MAASTAASRRATAADAGSARRRSTAVLSRTRQRGYGAEKPAIVLDVGSWRTRAGLAGEPRPRCVVPTPALLDPQHPAALRRSREQWAVLLSPFVNELVHHQLRVKPKEHRVVVCDPLLWPQPMAEAMARVLLEEVRVASVTFAPAAVVGVAGTGFLSGVLVDCGHRETRVVPVYDRHPITAAMRLLPVGGDSVARRLADLLVGGDGGHGADSSGAGGDGGGGDGGASALASVLRNGGSAAADAVAKLCVVQPPPAIPAVVGVDDGSDGHNDDAAGDVAPAMSYPVGSTGWVTLPGAARVGAAEVLFGDAEAACDDGSVASAVLDALLRCAVDVRAVVAQNVVVVGGTASLPGFGARLAHEIKALCASGPRRYATLRPLTRAVTLTAPPCRPAEAMWFGASAAAVVVGDPATTIVPWPTARLPSSDASTGAGGSSRSIGTAGGDAGTGAAVAGPQPLTHDWTAVKSLSGRVGDASAGLSGSVPGGAASPASGGVARSRWAAAFGAASVAAQPLGASRLRRAAALVGSASQPRWQWDESTRAWKRSEGAGAGGAAGGGGHSALLRRRASAMLPRSSGGLGAGAASAGASGGVAASSGGGSGALGGLLASLRASKSQASLTSPSASSLSASREGAGAAAGGGSVSAAVAALAGSARPASQAAAPPVPPTRPSRGGGSLGAVAEGGGSSASEGEGET